jgi:UDP-N-acetylmuramate: L-alanyl-gamma-D-glutamyl-meso-diaminopimelate ligase
MKIHFVAIGGSVMHNLAITLKKQGNIITGSDDEIAEPALSHLKKENLLPEANGWHPENIDSTLDAVIVGMHARDDNPEVLKAKELGIKMYSFPEFIYEFSKNKLRIVIGGSHGKTSITAMIMHVLKNCEFNFDYLVGSAVPGFEQSVKLSEAKVILIEGDEYPDSRMNTTPKFLVYKPVIGLISGIAWDHINVFPTYENYVEQFRSFANLIPEAGCLIYNHDDPEVLKIISSEIKTKCIPYSVPVYKIENGIVKLFYKNNYYSLMVFGKHNLSNLSAAWQVCRQLKINDEDFLQAIQTFSGAARRLELIGKNKTCSVYRDFAHAPSKLKATIAAVKELFPQRKLVAVFELHTFSSLSENFLSEYKNSMNGADVSVVFYSDHAIQLKHMQPLNPKMVLSAFSNESINIFTNKQALESFLKMQNWKETNLLLMSSGTFDSLNLSEVVNFVTP